MYYSQIIAHWAATEREMPSIGHLPCFFFLRPVVCCNSVILLMIMMTNLLFFCSYLFIVFFIVGMGKEVENLILENTELMATKYVYKLFILYYACVQVALCISML